MANEYVWKVDKENFRQLKSGRKKLEIRVGYPQIRKVKQGDIISFEGYSQYKFYVMRVGKYNSFKELLENEEINKILPDKSFEKALEILYGVYSEDEEKLGVYAFELKYEPTPGEEKFLRCLKCFGLLNEKRNQRFLH